MQNGGRTDGGDTAAIAQLSTPLAGLIRDCCPAPAASMVASAIDRFGHSDAGITVCRRFSLGFLIGAREVDIACGGVSNASPIARKPSQFRMSPFGSEWLSHTIRHICRQ